MSWGHFANTTSIRLQNFTFQAFFRLAKQRALLFFKESTSAGSHPKPPFQTFLWGCLCGGRIPASSIPACLPIPSLFLSLVRSLLFPKKQGKKNRRERGSFFLSLLAFLSGSLLPDQHQWLTKKDRSSSSRSKKMVGWLVGWHLLRGRAKKGIYEKDEKRESAKKKLGEKKIKLAKSFLSSHQPTPPPFMPLKLVWVYVGR